MVWKMQVNNQHALGGQMRKWINQLFSLICLSFLLLSFSCGRSVQPDAPAVVQDVSPETPVENPSDIREKQEKVFQQFLQDHPVRTENAPVSPSPDTAAQRREIVVIGNVKFSDVHPSPDLTKDPALAESYVLELDQFDPSYPDYLKRNGYQFGYYIPRHAVVVRAVRAEGQIPRGLKYLKTVMPYQPFMKIAKSDGDISRIRRLKVELWDASDSRWFEGYCQSNRIRILAGSSSGYVIEGRDLRKVLFEERVLRAEKYREGAVFSLSAKLVADTVLAGSVPPDLDTAEERVAVFDVGIERTHPDLTGAIRNVYETAGDNDTGEVTSHGTHVAGIIAGRGVLSRGVNLGANPGALIDFYAMGDDLKGLVIPPSLDKLFDLARKNGSRIANLSWGTYDDELNGRYLSVSRDADEYVYAHPDLIVVAAVGNNGKSIASPATAKNVIAVGALDGNSPADYSGRGGSSDGRTRPDVMVQGSGIISAGLNGSSSVESGTSQAAAVLSGLLSRITRIMPGRLGIEPTHATVKALLLANESPGISASGFGSLVFRKALTPEYFAASAGTGGLPAEIVRSVKAGDTLTVAIAWTDPPAYENAPLQLINDYDIEIISPSGKVFRSSDRINNAERLVISGTESGIYRMRIFAAFNPLAVTDIAMVVRSESGFHPVNTAQDDVAVQQQSVAAQNPQSAYVFVPPQNAPSGNTGSESQSGAGEVTIIPVPVGGSVISESVSPTLPPALPADTAPDSLEVLDSDNERNRTDTQKVYFKAGQNVLEARALGLLTNEALTVKFEGEGFAGDETVIPVQTANDTNYRRINVSVDGSDVSGDAWTNGVLGSLTVRDPATGATNSFPVLFRIDANPPALDGRYPAEGSVLTDTVAWIGIEDVASGVDPDMKIGVNGILLATNQFSYDFGAKRLSLYFDRILDGDYRGEVTVRFLKIADTAGNTLSNVDWVFTQDRKADKTPPDRPTGLSCAISNKRFDVSWNPSPEQDLSGYRVYQGDADYLNWKRISTDRVTESRFTFLSGSVSKIGVTAFDESGNESEMAVLDVDYEHRMSPPEILVLGVPERTNAAVTAQIVLRDEGLIELTNIRLNGRPAAVEWNETNGLLRVSDDGIYTLFCEVADDDTNVVTNIIRFTVDTRAPDQPQSLSWQATGPGNRDVALAWTGPSAGGETNGTSYNVYKGLERVASNVLATNWVSLNEDYGKFRYAVSAVDWLGNESAMTYVQANTESGFVFRTNRNLFSVLLDLPTDVRISTNFYSNMTVTLSATNGSVLTQWTFFPGHEVNPNADLSRVPDGDAVLAMRVNPREDGGLTFAREKRFGIDHTPPAVFVLANGRTNTGNRISVRRDSTVEVFVSDSHFASAGMTFAEDAPRDFVTNRFALPASRSGSVLLEAEDAAGNRTLRRVTIDSDGTRPFVEVSSVSEYVFGRVWDENLARFEVRTNDGLYFSSEFPAEGALCSSPVFKGNLSVSAWDLAGNSNSVSTNIDTTDERYTNRIDAIFVNGSDSRAYFNTSLLAVSLSGSVRGFVDYTLETLAGNAVMTSGLVRSTNYLMSGVGDSSYNIRVRSGSAEKVRPMTVDTLAPVIDIKPILRRGEAARDAVSLNEDNPESWKLTIDGTESDPDAVPAAGNRRFLVTARDLAGNSNTVARTVFVSDSAESAGEILADLPKGSVYWTDANGSVRTNTLAVFASKRRYFPRNAIVRAIGDITEENVTSDGWFAEEGDYHVVVSALSSGNSLTYEFDLTIDKTPPVAAMDWNIRKAYRDVPRVLVSDRNLSNWIFRLNGRDTVTNAGIGLPDGRHAVTLSASDMAGNTNIVTNVLTIDRTPPVVSSDLPDGSLVARVPECIIYDMSPVTAKTLLDGNSWDGIAAADGTYDRIAYSAVDEAGNSNGLTLRNITVDTRPPVIAVFPSGGWTRESSVMVTVSDAGLKISAAYLNGRSIETGKPVRIANDGDYEISVYAEDRAGNATNVRVNLSVDRTPPDVVIRNIQDGMAYPSGIRADIEVNDRMIVSRDIRLDGEDYFGDAIAAEGPHTLSVTAMDAAGNRTGRTVRFVVVRDLPVVTLSGVDGTIYAGRVFRADRFPLTASAGSPELKNPRVMVDETNRGSTVMIGEAGVYRVYGAGDVEVGGTPYVTSTPVYDLALDQTAPVIGLSGVTAGRTYSNSVSCSALVLDWISETVVELNGRPVPIFAQTNAGGMFTCQFSLTPASEYALSGQNTLQVRSTDILGRTSTETTVFQFVKTGGTDVTNDPDFLNDTNAPLIVLSNYRRDQIGQSNFISVTVADDYFKTCEIAIYTNGGLGYTNAGAITVTNPAFSLSFLNSWPDADYQVKVTALDWARNSSTAYAYFTLDRTEPAIQVGGVWQGACLYQANIIARAGDLHPFMTEIYLNGELKQTGLSNALFTLTEEREHSLEVRAMDAAGNTARSFLTFSVDRQEPGLTITGITNGGLYNTSRVVTVEVLDDHLSYFAVTNMSQQGGAPFLTFSTSGGTMYPAVFTNDFELTNTLSVYAVDRAGNSWLKSVRYVLDKTPPIITFASVTNNGFYNDAPLKITLVSGDNNALKSAVVTRSEYAGGVWNVVDTMDMTAATNVYYPLDGRFRLEAFALDEAGNVAVRTNVFTVDKVPPVFIINDLSNRYFNTNITLVISITDENASASESTLYVGGTFVALSQTPSNVYASVKLSNENEYRIDLNARDLAGNTSGYSYAVYIDKTVPYCEIQITNEEQTYFQNVDLYIKSGDINKAGYSGLRSIDWSIETNAVVTSYFADNYPGRSCLDNWRWSGFYGSPENHYSLICTAIDWAGNSNIASRDFVIDRTDPGAEFFRLIGTNAPVPDTGDAIEQDITYARVFDIISHITDENNIRTLQVWQSDEGGGNRTNYPAWTNNNDTVQEAWSTNPAPSFDVIKAARKWIGITATDFAGNVLDHYWKVGYVNSTPPWLVFKPKSMQTNDQLYIQRPGYDNHYISSPQYYLTFDVVGLADISLVSNSFIRNDGALIRMWYAGPWASVTNTTISNYYTNLQNDLSLPNGSTNIAGYWLGLVTPLPSSNIMITVISNISNIVSNTTTNVTVTSNEVSGGIYIFTYTTNIHTDINTNYMITHSSNAYFTGYRDHYSDIHVTVRDILNSETNYIVKSWVDVEKPIPRTSMPTVQVGSFGFPEIRRFTFRFDDLSGLSAGHGSIHIVQRTYWGRFWVGDWWGWVNTYDNTHDIRTDFYDVEMWADDIWGHSIDHYFEFAF